MSRTVSHDRGDHIEIVVYQDGVETSRTTKAKKGVTQLTEWERALKANGRRAPFCKHLGVKLDRTLKVECTCSKDVESNEAVHECPIIPSHRCLPNYHPRRDVLSRWNERKPESDIYQLCDQCEHFRLKEKT